MRLCLLSVLLGTLTGCFLFNGGGDEVTDDTAGDVDLYLGVCDVSCEEAGIDVTIEAEGADRAEVEFYYRAELVETFTLDDIDDRTWIGFFDYPSGHDRSDCIGSDDDWVCIIGRGDEEVRESQ